MHIVEFVPWFVLGVVVLAHGLPVSNSFAAFVPFAPCSRFKYSLTTGSEFSRPGAPKSVGLTQFLEDGF